jgi:uncharacterized integral membrane protein
MVFGAPGAAPGLGDGASGYDHKGAMSVPPEHIPGGETRVQASHRSRAESARTAGLVVLAVLITVFAVINLDEVKVHWIVGSGRAPLIVVIAISLLIGIVLARLADRLTARRRR